jgi:hypothetical protein
MKLRSLTAIAAIVAGAAGVAGAQTVKFDGTLLEFYYTQMMDNNLRRNSAAHSPAYFAQVTGTNENQFLIKRAELYLSGTVNDDISWNLMFDPNLTSGTNTTFGAVLQDAMATWKIVPGFSVKVGQGKYLQSYESTSIAARNIVFIDRSMLSRFIGERRDRGILAQYDFGDPKKGPAGKFSVAITNGMSDNGTGGKQPEANAQKDVHARLDLNLKGNIFGFYYRTGSTDVSKGVTVPGATTAWGTSAPTAAAIQDNADKMSNLGVFYFKDTSTYQIFGEAATGLLGRRFATVFAPPVAPATVPAMSREHLDQKYLGYVVQGAYKMGKHWLTARYDFINYNSGDQWYTATNPYKKTVSVGGVNTDVDYSPKFTEITVGYNYVFIPTKYSAGKLKLNYILRSKNFLAPRAGQTGEQGGDSLVASLMVSF